jgi:lysophospholipase L1-like esterase
MDWYEAEVHALEKSLHETPLPEDPAVFYGSSSIRMWSDLASDLQDLRAVNVGFGGSTLEACAFYFERLVASLDPASIVVYAGDNDLGDGRSPQHALGCFRSLADKVEQLPAAVPFGFVSIKLSPVRVGLRTQIVCANSLIQEEIARRPQAYYIDVFEAMLDETGQPRPELFLEDGLHLSRVGYRLWAELLEPYRNRIFIPSLPDICA